MNMSVPSEWQVLVSLYTDKTVKLLSHVVNITVYSGGMFWCKLWQHFGWQLLYWTLCHMLMYAIYPFQKYKFTHYCMWDIDWKRLDRIPSYTFTSGLTKKKTKQTKKTFTMSLWYREGKKKYGHKDENKKISPLCNSCVCLYSVCFPTEESWDEPLSYFREMVYHWLIYILFISQDSLAQFMPNLQKV